MVFKFRSWMLVVIGMIVQFIFGLIYYIHLKTMHSTNLGGVFAAIGIAVLALFAMVSPFLGIIPLIFLIPRKTVIAGGVLALIFAIFCFILRVAFPLGIFLLAAGVIALWKRI